MVDAIELEFVEVVLMIDHGHTNDLLIKLEAPGGQMIILADHVTGTTFGGSVYSDLAEHPNNSAYASHVAKRYRPKEPLHSLYGASAAGTWKLHVADDTDSNRADALGGTLLAWALRFTSIP